MRRRIRTEQDLEAALSIFPNIQELAERVAKIAKTLPLEGKEVDELVPEKDEELIMRFLVIVRQDGELAQSIKGMVREPYRLSEQERYAGWRSYIFSALGQKIFQVERICELLGFDFQEMRAFGKENNQEKREEYSKKDPGCIWY